jgi:hypothetical protein
MGRRCPTADELALARPARFFNTIPHLIISLLANLSNVARYVAFFQEWQKSSEIVFQTVFSAVFG